MTTHLDDELLAQWVLDNETPDAAAADHLQLCARCRTSLAELQSLVAIKHDLPRLQTPADTVWQAIVDDLGTDYGSQGPTNVVPGPAAVGPEATTSGQAPAEPSAVTPTGDTAARDKASEPARRANPRHIRRTFRGSALALAATVAAVLGVCAGSLATLVVTDDEGDQPVAEVMVRLEPLTGKSGDGNADLIRAAAGTQLKVDAAGLAAANGFYEVWLINADGKRMVSLGVLNPQTGGTFQVPANLTSQGYRIVDVSLEPEDGNPEHSRDSVIRGTLPG